MRSLVLVSLLLALGCTSPKPGTDRVSADAGPTMRDGGPNPRDGGPGTRDGGEDPHDAGPGRDGGPPDGGARDGGGCPPAVFGSTNLDESCFGD